MTLLSPLFDQTYTANDPILVWNLDGSAITVQEPACGYAQKLEASNVPVFIVVTPGS